VERNKEYKADQDIIDLPIILLMILIDCILFKMLKTRGEKGVFGAKEIELEGFSYKTFL
jgi:hypothetical protein